MKIEAVIVCKDYADFLEHTLPENMQFFDRLVVVTHYKDKATQGLCHKYGIDCIQTDQMHDDGAAFNKGKAINLGLGHLAQDAWVLHLDADILLPHNFLGLLRRAHLNKDNIYGADRVNVFGCDHWLKHRDKRVPSHTHGYFVEPPPEFPMGARIVHKQHGYVPIGYFQLWHGGRSYPTTQGSAEHTDVLFACQWARFQRVLLPEVFVYHLDSNVNPGDMGENWNGRKTPPFVPSQGYCPDLGEWKEKSR